ncbi:hypothetical protein [Stenotrophomonas sp. SY1]|uniref:hypothetical protein n=1 Tax=Stenotrophomonas sp. SY1 TaxID=477235 RepID=UPI001E4B21D2|nr:hypothetical protein [Stenotrophomonas sp. SY1]MCD9086212.1 hypothetical protein [Stenotrophomonas sp. SY1]
MTQQLPERGIAVMEATTASSPVAAVLASMRLIDPEGGPVEASRVREWADILMTQLYSAHAVRWEYRRKDDLSPGCWVLANANIVFSAQRRGLVVRALFENPTVSKPAREHDFDRRTGECRHCKIGLTWAGPDCMPPPPPPRDPRTVLPFSAAWLIEPLEKLLYLTKYLNHSDSRRWRQETEFLLEKLQEFIAEAKKR